MAKCKKCGQEIRWIRLDTGKSMPCDPEQVMYWQHSKGRQRIVSPNGEVLTCRLNGELRRATGIGYLPHDDSCPKRSKSRKSSI